MPSAITLRCAPRAEVCALTRPTDAVSPGPVGSGTDLDVPCLGVESGASSPERSGVLTGCLHGHADGFMALPLGRIDRRGLDTRASSAGRSAPDVIGSAGRQTGQEQGGRACEPKAST